ncbi:hypothetical protein DL767_005271 [Monosporascus sp. MG133]|nr:hypothetical protein DL767_005271 [Monosporascus sp. MG133]
MCAQARNPEIIPATGLTVVVPHDNPTLDIVFVHGFTGHPERTWSHKRGDSKQSEDDHDETSEPQSKSRRLNPFSTAHRDKDSAHSAVFWPRDLLPTTVPNARVMTYGYDIHIRHWAGPPVCRHTVRDIAWDFLVALEAVRRAEPARPLLFVVHSLGGIVVKELLRRSSGCRQGQSYLRSVFESAKGTMFFGTPHDGADPRGILQHIAELVIKAIGFKVNEQIVNSLLPSSERLGELRDEFGPLAYEQRWIIHSFQEQLGIKALNGRKVCEQCNFPCRFRLTYIQVVEDTSSYLNLPAIETTEHIGRNHMDMCRFSGPEDVEYKKVAAALRRMTANLPENQIPNPRPSLTPEQRRQLRDSLMFDLIDARHMCIRSAHAKTCRWLRNKGEYLDWLNPSKFSDHHGFFWVKGKPGTGKSTLMKFALAQARMSMKDWVVLSFFFNARGEELEKTTAGMYRSLLLQLLESIPELDAVFDSLWLTVWPQDGQMQWSVESLMDLFEQAVQSLGQSRVICFIDALDECDDDQIRDMLSSFERVGELAVASNIRFQVCFSSRHYPSITVARGLELVLEGQEGHYQDVANYVGSKLRIGHSKVAEEIRAEIQAKASSVFMWVVLVVDILNREYDPGRIHALRKRLREIPAGLHDLFRDILTRDARDRDEFILCIQWILCAKRPLRPEELYFAVLAGTEPGSLGPRNREIATLTRIQRFVLDSSKGLAETTKSKSPVVQFIHESVRDFLLKDNGLRDIWPDLGDRFYGQSHEQLKECCLTYTSKVVLTLQLPDPLPKASSKDAAALRDRTQQSSPFLEYAIRNVLYHADEAESDGINQSGFLRSFPLQSWINMDNLFEQFEIRRRSSEASLLYILAERNLARLIKAHFTASPPLEASQERYENPFFAALATGSTDAVRALAELELHGMNPSTSFQRLCQSYLKNLNQIPKLGLDFCPSKYSNWVKLAKQGKVEGARLLLATGRVNLVDIDAKDDSGYTPLFWAAENGHEAMVKLLLSTGKVDPDAKNNSGRTPLILAVKNGDEAMIKLLLDTGKVDPDAKDDSGRTPLSLAAGNWHNGEAIVKLLLTTGKVNPDAKDNSGRTPLFWAAEKGREAIVNLLLNTGKVNGDSMGTDGRTPLSWAAENGHEAIVKLLLDIGRVDIDLRDKDDRTPLWYAVEKACKPIVRLLSVQSLAKPRVPLEDLGVTKNVEVVRKRNLRTDDHSLNIEAVQPGPPTDSGYASTTHDKYGHTQSTGDVQFQPPIDKIHASTINNMFEGAYDQNDPESDDVGTIYSDASSLPALAEEGYISELADDLFKRICSGQSDGQIIERISEILPELLKAFALKVGHNALSQMHRDVMFFVHKHRNDIVEDFKGRPSHKAATLPEDKISGSDKMPLNEVMGLWDKNLEDPEDDAIPENTPFGDRIDTVPPDATPENTPFGDRIDTVPPDAIHEASADDLMNQDFNKEGDRKDNQESSTPPSRAYKDFIFNSPAYEWLLASLRKEILLAPAEPNSLEAIRREIIKSLPSSHIVSRKKPAEAYKMTFVVEWSPLAFVIEQGYEEEPDEAIGIAVTLTGSATDAQALTSAQYLCQTWPTVGEHIIRLVREVVRSGTGHRHKWAADANYAIEPSRLSWPHEGCALEKVLLYGGQIVTGGFPFSIGQKDTPVRISRSGYTPKLKWIHEKFVVLWDEEDKRGWLVNGSSALLHLLRASLEYDSIDEFNSEFRFKREDMQEAPESHKANSAVKVLLNRENMKLEIYPEKEDYVRVKNRVEDLLDILEKIIDYQFLAASQSGVNLKFRARKHLEGWDFNDLAKPSDPIHPRVATLQTPGKSWVDFTRAVHAVTLFGRGFGELIQPADTVSCAHWAKLPKGKYYLAACVYDLQKIMDRNGDQEANPMKLSDNIIWHNPDKIFEPCQCTEKLQEEHSDFVQVLLPSGFRGDLPKRDPLRLTGRGAVIFGDNMNFKWYWKDTGHPEEGISPSPSKQSEIRHHDSGIGSSLSSSAAEARGDFADSSSQPPSESSSGEMLTYKHYKIGVICALPKELMAVLVLFDSKHEVSKTPPKDDNSYFLGRIGEHNVVATCLPEYGTNAAAAAVTHMTRSFPVKFCLLVGIGGGVPSKKHDIRLGDVVVSNTGVIQYDLVKLYQGGIPERTGCLPPPPLFLTKTISNLRSDPNISMEPLRKYVEDIVARRPEYKDPGPEHDELFEAEYVHDRNHESCEQCNTHKIGRKPRPENHPIVHYGSIASGNQVMKDAQTRDKLGAQDKVLCFEMEAAGIMKIVPCLVIRGICDYADTHKNKLWQEYAAATAAAYAKFFLSFVGNSKDLESMPADSETVKSNHSRKRPAESLQFGVSCEIKKPRQG